MKSEIPIRLTLASPPPGVRYALQRGKDEIVSPATSDGSDLSFVLTLTYSGPLETGAPRWTGPFSQGPVSERFVYVLIGTSAGDLSSPWTRRLKLHLSAITVSQVESADAQPGSILTARFAGTDKKGEPTCASQHPLDPGWSLVNR